MHIHASAALEAAANAILITDRTGAVRWGQPEAFTAMTGYDAEEVLGQNPRFLKSGEQDPSHYSKLWETILKGGTWRGELTNRRKNGTLFYAEQTIAPVRSESRDITHFVGIMNDITDRKQLEAQFIEAQKMEVVEPVGLTAWRMSFNQYQRSRSSWATAI